MSKISAGFIAALPSVLAPTVDGSVLFCADSAAGASCSTSISGSSTTSVVGPSGDMASAVAVPSESAAAAAAAGDSLSAGGTIAGVEGDLTERPSA